MSSFDLITRVRRYVHGAGSMRRLLWSGLAIGALVTLVVLGGCGRSSQNLGPETQSQDGTNEGVVGNEENQVENEAGEELEEMKNAAVVEQQWNEAAAKGQFETEYRVGETTPSPTAASATVTLVGAGDIATSGSNDTKTAALLDNISGTVFTMGDNAYSDGSASNFKNYYAPTWGRHKSRTRPSPGNHDYNTSGASAYYSYFGSNAGPSGRGYYSYNLGDWHIISLNSNIGMSSTSSQYKWLKSDLAANVGKCVLAYWHHPRFSSGDHGSSTKSKPIYQALYDAGAEIVVVGHDHNYERFAPQRADGTKDLARGIRQFVVGTGGTSLRSMSSTVANSEKRSSSSHGVIKFTLGPGTYAWEFIPVSGKTFRDSGSGTCHN